MLNIRTIVTVAFLGFAASVSAGGTDEAPRSFVASPDVYRVVGQNDQYLVIEVTWKPGQRDEFHSHPAVLSYRLTDCNLRSHAPDGKSQDNVRKAGVVASQGPTVSHSMENIGESDCKLIMFEPVGYVPEWQHD